MFHRSRLLSTSALAVLGWLFVAGPVSAQVSLSDYRSAPADGYDFSRDFSAPAAAPSPANTAPAPSSFALPQGGSTAGQASTTPAYRSFALAQGQAKPAGNGILLNVWVLDPNAEIWVDGAATNLKGTLRQFISPPVKPGQEYTYDIRARWQDNGKLREESRTVRVRAGQRVRVDFTLPNQAVSKAKS